MFKKKIEILVNSTKKMLFDEDHFTFSDNLNVEKAVFKSFTSEFELDSDTIVYLSSEISVIQNLSLILYGIEIDGNEEDMLQDGLNELLNLFIGNAAKDLEEMGLDFSETLMPTKSLFKEDRLEYNNFQIDIPTEMGEVTLAFSVRNRS